jgi:general secretion pathway protein F
MKRYLIFYKFFLSASLIVKSKHNFQDALIYSKHTANNQYFLDKVSHIIQEINNGTSLNQAFKNSNLFEEINIRMISVGENINNFELILENLTYLNKQQLTKSLDEFIAILNPFLIFIISSFILWLVLAIMTPVWEMSNFIK